MREIGERLVRESGERLARVREIGERLVRETGERDWRATACNLTATNGRPSISTATKSRPSEIGEQKNKCRSDYKVN